MAENVRRKARNVKRERWGRRRPGLIESIYERCLIRELELRQVAAVNQRVVKIEYKGFCLMNRSGSTF